MHCEIDSRLRAGALVGGAQLGGDDPLLGLLQVEHARDDRPQLHHTHRILKQHVQDAVQPPLRSQ